MSPRPGALAIAAVLCMPAFAAAQTYGGLVRTPAAAPAPNAFVEPAPQDEVEKPLDRTRADEVLRGRQKAPMHPGEPLQIVGIEAGDPALREGTPALARATASAPLVDVEALRLRTIAMVSERRTFHQAPRSSDGVTPAQYTQQTDSRTNARSHTDTNATRASAVSVWTWIGALAGAALLAFLAVRRTMGGAA